MTSLVGTPLNPEVQRNRNAVLWFVLLTFVMTWSLWSLFWLWDIKAPDPHQIFKSSSGITVQPKTDPRFVPLALAATLIPGFVAFVVTCGVRRESWRTTTLDRVGNKQFYLWALLLPPVLVFMTICLSVATGAARFEPNIAAFEAALLAGAILAPEITIYALAEELGWRGFLLPRLLLSGLGQSQALAVTGLVWGFWHAPIILRGYNYWGHPSLGVPMMVVFCVLLGIIIGWLRLAGGSVWVAAAAHTSVNLTMGLAGCFLVEYDSIVAGSLTSLIGWIPLGAFCAWLAWSRRLPVRGMEIAKSVEKKA